MLIINQNEVKQEPVLDFEEVVRQFQGEEGCGIHGFVSVFKVT